MEWKHLFREKVLERGEEYFEEGRIEDFELDGNYINANVIGNEDYEVSIRIDKEQLNVMDMDCTCMHAQEGYCCKHMAAVLYMWEEIEENKEAELDVNTLLKMSSEEQRYLFLKRTLESNANLKHSFKMLVSSSISSKDLMLYKNKFSNIIRNHTGNSGYIYYYNVCDFLEACSKYCDTYLYPLMNANLYDEAFSLYRHIILEMNNIGLEEFEDAREFEIELRSALEYIYENADSNLQYTIRNYALTLGYDEFDC